MKVMYGITLLHLSGDAIPAQDCDATSVSTSIDTLIGGSLTRHRYFMFGANLKAKSGSELDRRSAIGSHRIPAAFWKPLMLRLRNSCAKHRMW